MQWKHLVIWDHLTEGSPWYGCQWTLHPGPSVPYTGTHPPSTAQANLLRLFQQTMSFLISKSLPKLFPLLGRPSFYLNPLHSAAISEFPQASAHSGPIPTLACPRKNYLPMFAWTIRGELQVEARWGHPCCPALGLVPGRLPPPVCWANKTSSSARSPFQHYLLWEAFLDYPFPSVS